MATSITEIQETADEIIKNKIQKASETIQGNLMIEDTSLYFEA